MRAAVSSAIDRLLEAIHADAAVSVDEALAGLADRAVLFDRALDRIDDPGLVEAGAGYLGLRGFLVARAAEQQLVAFAALPVDAEDADVACVMVAAGVDAAADLDLELADVVLPRRIGEALRQLLRERDRPRVGEAAIVQARAGDDVGDEVEVGLAEARLVERGPQRVKVGLADVRQDQVLRMRRAQLVEAVPFGQ